MNKQRWLGLATVLALATLAVTPTAAQALGTYSVEGEQKLLGYDEQELIKSMTSGPRYTKNAVPMGSEPVTVVSWGTISLTASGGGAGEITCHTVAAGTVANVEGHGAGSTQLFATYHCESTTCFGAPYLTAQHLPWSSALAQVGSFVRSKIQGASVRVTCVQSGSDESRLLLLGSFEPILRNGTSALHPSFLEFYGTLNPGQYAALGDSYSSGEGIPGTGNGGSTGSNTPYYEKTNTPSGEFGAEVYQEPAKAPKPEQANECHRDKKAYPARVAEALSGPGVAGETEVFLRQPHYFIFRACSGAVAENMWVPEGANGGQWPEWIEPANEWLQGPAPSGPAQDLWLEIPGGGSPVTNEPNAQIELVTFSIGGNDSGFAKVGANCVDSNSLIVNSQTEYGREKCKRIIKEWETDKNEKTMTKKVLQGPEEPGKAEGMQSIERKLPVVLSDVHAFAPNAWIRVVTYPNPIDVVHKGNIPLGEAEVKVAGKTSFFLDNEPTFFNENQEEPNVARALAHFVGTLNSTIQTTTEKWAKAEEANGVKVNVQVVNTSAAFAGHRLGDETGPLAEKVRSESVGVWVNGLVFRPTSLTLEEPVPSAESFHPNCPGHAAMAKVVLESLQERVPAGLTCP